MDTAFTVRKFRLATIVFIGIDGVAKSTSGGSLNQRFCTKDISGDEIGKELIAMSFMIFSVLKT